MINVTIMLIVWHKWKRCTGSLKVADLATSMETKEVCQKKIKTQILDREHQITVSVCISRLCCEEYWSCYSKKVLYYTYNAKNVS